MTPLQIYLTDDDHEDRELFIEALRELPIETDITQFDNGVDLMADLFSDKELPDAIFLDLYMPIMDGFECLADIRNFSKFSDIQVIVFSSYYRKREINQLKLDGANQFLQKPTSFDQMKSLLYKSLRLIQSDSATTKGITNFIAIS
ncbi:response regulator [Pareuzebyella sediminis]|uniref:response regulator n=1 Tax=Pareuzebyella sediminis TaxID=2607998 RepID=UPI0011EC70B3|nr:response regulator [Pareuzebyella sediminis]